MVSLGRTHCPVILRPHVPDVVIGGAPRSGTTFLCELLAKHPDVYVARPFIPEPKVCLTPHPAGDAGILARYAPFFTAAPDMAVRVEKTSYYLENEHARERLVRLLPNAKFVFILREPVARAYSNWRWSRRNGLESLPFREAVEQEGRRSQPFPADREYVRPFDYMLRGRYGTLAEAWLNAVGRKRLAFYVMESALSSPERFVAELQRFVDVKPVPWDRLATGKINSNDVAGESIDPGHLIELRDRIRPEIRRFAEVTGVDVSVWGY
jgi:hypothetical protein